MSWIVWQLTPMVVVLVWALLCARGCLRLADGLAERAGTSRAVRQAGYVGLGAATVAAVLVGLWVVAVIHGFLLDGTFAD